MYPFDKNNLFRRISVKLLLPIFLRSGLSANAITVLNFLTLGLGSVILFIRGYEILGLLTAGLMAMVDYIDGTVARKKKQISKLGEYLDTSLDWLYLMLLIGAISYAHKIMGIGYLCLVAIVFSNWIEFSEKVKVELPKFLGITPLLVGSILIGHAEWGIIGICVTQWVKTLIMYRRSLWNTYKS